MIPRYTLPAMGSLWSDEHRLRVMLHVELLVLEAQAALGLVPRRAVAAIRRKARVNLAQIARREARTRHDVIAFIEHLEDHVGPDGRYLHFGLTSSDVLDTSLAVLLLQATDLLLRDLTQLRQALAGQARRHRRTLMIGRTHGGKGITGNHLMNVRGWSSVWCTGVPSVASPIVTQGAGGVKNAG